METYKERWRHTDRDRGIQRETESGTQELPRRECQENVTQRGSNMTKIGQTKRSDK